MREKGYDRSPTMCTDKWRNLLKEFKKAKHQSKGSGSAKMSYYKELDELLKERSKNAPYKALLLPRLIPICNSLIKVLKILQFHLDLLKLVDSSANGGDNHPSYVGRVILVKWGEYTKRIGIDGTAEAIKEAIKSAFGLRTKRAFWLEDEDDVVRSFDRDMPLGTYTLHLDEGISIKVCMYDDTDRIPVQTEEKTLYTEKDFCDFLSRRGWTGLRELSGFRSVDTLDELRPGAMYQGIR
uniref:Trihelix transcription factor GT-1 n=1 Tax=Ananas comosus var. bracteatus TaxID=296719 RepID=A0A6V7NN79_ANACO|nr:unnamed protein product [Ananas comosus var. bracteatus]